MIKMEVIETTLFSLLSIHLFSKNSKGAKYAGGMTLVAFSISDEN
jgi:hypothetical protein